MANIYDSVAVSGKISIMDSRLGLYGAWLSVIVIMLIVSPFLNQFITFIAQLLGALAVIVLLYPSGRKK